MTTQPKPYTAVRLVRQKGRDEFDSHFTVDWDSARELFDPARLFYDHAGDAKAGEVWALWHTPIGAGWRIYADTHQPDFLLVKHFGWEALMVDKAHGTEIRELSANKKGVSS